jgi:hypothetical protein
LQNDAPVGGGAHTPTLAPSPISQRPVQQSSARAQMSPAWMQNDAESAQVPSLHRLEQHCSLPSQALPAVLQERLSATHLSSTQEPPQHSLPAVQASPSDTQLPAPQWPPPSQSKLQQSVAAPHASPSLPHCSMLDAHVSLAGSHRPEQHVPEPAQVSP